MRKGTIWGDGSMPIFLMTMSNLLSTNVVVSILVSVYSHKHRADYTHSTVTLHGTFNLLHTINKKSQMVPFLTRWSLMFTVTKVSSGPWEYVHYFNGKNTNP